jgi:hypothetical protein
MMDIDEAIKRLDKSLNSQYFDENNPKAIQLGIEALERIRTLRSITELDTCTLLGLMNLINKRLPNEAYIPKSVGKLPINEGDL